MRKNGALFWVRIVSLETQLDGRFGYFLFFLGRRKGESEAQGGEGIGSLLKIPGGGGGSRRGARGSGGCLRRIGIWGGGAKYFFRRRNVHQDKKIEEFHLHEELNMLLATYHGARGMMFGRLLGTKIVLSGKNLGHGKQQIFTESWGQGFRIESSFFSLEDTPPIQKQEGLLRTPS